MCLDVQNKDKDAYDISCPLESELLMSTPTYDPFGTETTYNSKLFLCQMGHKQQWT